MIAELPLVAINVQRGGPSTGLPTKTEQSDLLQALHGRNGESPCIIIAAKSPSDCFATAIEAARLATKYMCPVILLTDGYIANGAEPWLIPDKSAFEEFQIRFSDAAGPEGYLPYDRDEVTLARPWATPGTPELEHRIGGLEKAEGTGNVSYDANNHEHMCRTRAEKVQRAIADVPDAEVRGESSGDLLFVGWGGTYGSLRTATEELQASGLAVSHMHLRHMNPLPANVGDVLKSFKHVVAAELNLGQLRGILRDRFLVDVQGYNKIQGQPFKVQELTEMAKNLLEVSE
jgi:2-oxoglutarate ferredoxin oxidoreductase subunit alpha